ncbi:hypothetical protein KRP22_004783 [Phytophthora ramorum]|nr:hypothetical protein KRP22_10414 [Phytophthora ramorum]
MLPEAGNEAERAGRTSQGPSLWRAATRRCCECIRARGEWCNACRVEDEQKAQETGNNRLETPESFDFGSLGPPPPCGPILCRQKASDFSEARERKRAGLSVGEDELGPVQPRLLTRVNRRLPTPTDHCPLMM